MRKKNTKDTYEHSGFDIEVLKSKDLIRIRFTGERTFHINIHGVCTSIISQKTIKTQPSNRGSLLYGTTCNTIKEVPEIFFQLIDSKAPKSLEEEFNYPLYSINPI